MENNVIEETKTERKEFNLKEVFVLWKHVEKVTNKLYLTGNTSEFDKDSIDLKGEYNTDKTNEKAPDIIIYTKDNKEYASLWINTSKDGNMYLTGVLKETKAKLVGFYTKELINNRPNIKVYYQEEK